MVSEMNKRRHVDKSLRSKWGANKMARRESQSLTIEKLLTAFQVRTLCTAHECIPCKFLLLYCLLNRWVLQVRCAVVL